MNGDVHKPIPDNQSSQTTASSSKASVGGGGGGGSTMPNSTSVPNIAKLSTLSPTQQQQYRQDWLDRDSQASSLAAAGMVAESVVNQKQTNHNNNDINHHHHDMEPYLSLPTSYVTTTMPVLGLQPPPTIMAPQPGMNNTGSESETRNVTELDSINWNLMDIGGMTIDDMELDFATLFDPSSEYSGMEPTPVHDNNSTNTDTVTSSFHGWQSAAVPRQQQQTHSLMAPNSSSSTERMSEMTSISPTPLSTELWSERILLSEESVSSQPQPHLSRNSGEPSR
jgi:hypothetical protein